MSSSTAKEAAKEGAKELKAENGGLLGSESYTKEWEEAQVMVG